MVKVLLLEDEPEAMRTLSGYFERYAAENKRAFEIKEYRNAVDLLEEYDATADVVMLDIQMPLINGMTAAKKIRERDKNVLIVFVTNLQQYAVEGYEVNAFDFILKPVRYASFSMKLTRLLTELGHRSGDATITVSGRGGVHRITVSDIMYVEVSNHEVMIHTVKGNVGMRTTLSALTERLSSFGFALCNSCYLVNMKYVTGVDGEFVVLGDERLRVSQPKRKAFLQAIAEYLGGSK